MIDAEEKGLLWLCACTDFDYRQRAQLLRAAKTPKNLFLAFEKVLFSVIKEGEYSFSRGKTLQEREEDVQKVLDYLQKRGYFYLTIFSEDYPASLKALPDPPFVLFGKGNRELLSKRKFSIVGSRITPPHAEKQGKEVAEILSSSFVIVTGMAEGGDHAAIKGALESGNLICVLANGLDEYYPAAHASLQEEVAKRGLLLSEYPPWEKVKKYRFFARNRILAGLSEGVLILSAGVRSGALITASRALEYGRDVFAFPYNVGVSQGAGCNELIKQGAYLCTSAEDILSLYGIQFAPKKKVELSEAEQKIMIVLREEGELHAAVIAERTGLKIYEVAATLSALELKGLAAKAGGNRYCAI